EDIRNTRKIHKVILNGKVIPTEYQPQYQNPILRPVRNHEEPSFYRRPEVEPILAPQVAVEGSPEVELTVRGSYFVPLSVVRFNGVPVPTTFTSGSVLKGRVSSSLLVAPGTYPVTVVNPAPGGGESDPAYFIVKFR
ncbi:MAG: hypothetical protein HY652_05545, partial [Acidobacteria bacterium]|nr:hypothetical protein [Acidobacteriota bacterium]